MSLMISTFKINEKPSEYKAYLSPQPIKMTDFPAATISDPRSLNIIKAVLSIIYKLNTCVGGFIYYSNNFRSYLDCMSYRIVSACVKLLKFCLRPNINI